VLDEFGPLGGTGEVINRRRQQERVKESPITSLTVAVGWQCELETRHWNSLRDFQGYLVMERHRDPAAARYLIHVPSAQLSHFAVSENNRHIGIQKTGYRFRTHALIVLYPLLPRQCFDRVGNVQDFVRLVVGIAVSCRTFCVNKLHLFPCVQHKYPLSLRFQISVALPSQLRSS
jgi:hypothetical protein